jgi:antitoxin (DNA-binding transcriptional repressor) of toxin-antitoxin stability system
MAMTVNMHEAKTNFSKLAKLVEQGEEIRIARDGLVIMRLVKFVEELETPRDFSVLRGLSSPVTDAEWEAMDQEFLDSIEYRELDV